jgi:hypothetical protein
MADPFFERVGTAAPGNRAKRHRSEGGAVEAAAPTPSVQAPISLATTGEKRWAANHDTFWGATQTYDELPPGLYRCDMSPNVGPVLNRVRVETDNLLELPDDAASSLIREFEKFWKIGEEFTKRGFLHKRGFLLWGPPGSGKTSAIGILIKRLVREYGGVVLFLDHPGVAAQCLQMVRSIEPKRPMIAIMEDMDALVERHGEHEYLALLDGEAQVANIVFLSTTNYPERLDRRFVDRPSRFDTIRFIGMPSAEARRVYLSAKEPSLSVDGDELEQWVRLSDGFSVAHLKEMIVAVRCFGQPLEEVAERLAQMQARQPISTDAPDRLPFGFASNGNGALHHAGAGRIS